MSAFELVIHSEFGPRAQEICDGLLDTAVGQFQYNGGTQLAAFVRTMNLRFSEYAKALGDSEGNGGMIRLGSRALSNIYGVDAVTDFEAIMTCSIHFGAILKGFTGIASKYRII